MSVFDSIKPKLAEYVPPEPYEGQLWTEVESGLVYVFKYNQFYPFDPAGRNRSKHGLVTDICIPYYKGRDHGLLHIPMTINEYSEKLNEN